MVLPMAGPDADAGSIYPEIAGLARRCDFRLGFASVDRRGLAARRRAIRAKVLELFHYEPPPVKPRPVIVGRWETRDCVQEKMVFSTTPWFRVPAYVLIPRGRTGRRPAVVDLHSHGGMFVYGKEKVMPVPGGDPAAVARYRRENYDGRSTALELCRRGYVVVSIDAFYFGERRSIWAEDLERSGGDRRRYSPATVRRLNRRAAQGESALARSLFWAGVTWQGIAHWDDLRTLDYLLTRPEVDPDRVGCVGISMGGDRAAYLAGLDERVRCAVVVGWMSTLRPMIRRHVWKHSFMHFLPGLTRYLDLPDLVACMAPQPLMVQQCRQDALFPPAGMKEAVEKIAATYRLAGAAGQFAGRFYDEPHRFSRHMQEEAFAWLDQTLQP